MVVKLAMCVIPAFLLFFYHRTDGLECRRSLFFLMEVILAVVSFFTDINEQFILSLLVFHAYTDELTGYLYNSVSVLAGLAETVIFLLSPSFGGHAVCGLLAAILIVTAASRFGAFAAGDAYFIIFIITGMAAQGKNPFSSACELLLFVCIAFVLRAAALALKEYFAGRNFTVEKTAPFMSSVLAGFLVCTVLY